MTDLAPLIERLAFDAWPAAEVVALAGWQLRFNHGVTNRANSVWPNRATGTLSLEERIAAVEHFYRNRGQPARFQIAPCSEPSGLDAALDARGYAVYSPVTLLVAESVEILAEPIKPPGIEVLASDTLDDAWFALSGEQGRYRGDESARYRAILEGARDQPVFIRATLGGELVGVGLGVGQDGWMGVFSMLTLPEARRRGVARAVLQGLARQAAERGWSRLYLQVEQENRPARKLYENSGFRFAYGYHYRRLELD